MRVYLAGPMRGLPDCNFPAFAAAEQRWRDAGHSPVSPARLSAALGLEPDRGDDPTTEGGRLHLRLAAQIDLAVLYAVDAIALLPGWQNSRGATMELGVAQFPGLPVYCAETMRLLNLPLCPWSMGPQWRILLGLQETQGEKDWKALWKQAVDACVKIEEKHQ